MFEFKGRTILITGGTGSLGQKLVDLILQKGFGKIIILSRHEHLQVEMKRKYPLSRIRFFIGDIRDRDRLMMAFKGVDYVIHAAALKHVDVCYYNPSETVKTNVYGAQNIIDAAIERNVNKVLAVSTDKACLPVNLYGAAKLTADFLFLSSSVYTKKHGTRFSVVRYGNFWNSRGSVVEYFHQLKEQGKKEFPITNINMTRYFINLEDAAEFCLFALAKMKGGEIFVPKMRERLITDVAKEIDPDVTFREIGMRPGEKITEDLVSDSDQMMTEDCGEYWRTDYLHNHKKDDL